MYPVILEHLPDMEYANELNDISQRLDAVVSYYIDKEDPLHSERIFC